MSRVATTFPTMGTDAAVWLSGPRPEAELRAVAAAVRADVEAVEAALTRFDPASELSRLNADPREVVPASPTLRRFVLAARWAGVASDGRVDATRLPDVEAAGYVASRAGVAPPPLAPALADAPPRRVAGAHPDRGYLRLEALAHGVRRPAGVRLDSGGLGKGLAADLAAARVPAGVAYAIGVGGDLAVGGPAPQAVDVLRAAGDGSPPGAGVPADVVHRLSVGAGGVATSAVHRRLWRGDNGRPAHHLIDPATGEPAWTGLVAVTAVGADALEAEVLAKAALLAGPLGARRVLRRGGVLQHDDGRVEVVAGAPVVRLRRAA